jgi:hypothetical protein
MNDIDRLAALLHEEFCGGRTKHWTHGRDEPSDIETRHAARLIAAGVTLAATPAPLDVLRARTALALALEETEGEWRGCGSSSWMAKVVWPVMEAHIAAAYAGEPES